MRGVPNASARPRLDCTDSPPPRPPDNPPPPSVATRAPPAPRKLRASRRQKSRRRAAFPRTTKTLQRATKTLQRATKTLQRATKTFQRATKTFQRATKTFQRATKTFQRATKTFQRATKTLRRATKTLQRATKTPRRAAKVCTGCHGHRRVAWRHNASLPPAMGRSPRPSLPRSSPPGATARPTASPTTAPRSRARWRRCDGNTRRPPRASPSDSCTARTVGTLTVDVVGLDDAGGVWFRTGSHLDAIDQVSTGFYPPPARRRPAAQPARRPRHHPVRRRRRRPGTPRRRLVHLRGEQRLVLMPDTAFGVRRKDFRPRRRGFRTGKPGAVVPPRREARRSGSSPDKDQPSGGAGGRVEMTRLRSSISQRRFLGATGWVSPTRARRCQTSTDPRRPKTRVGYPQPVARGVSPPAPEGGNAPLTPSP